MNNSKESQLNNLKKTVFYDFLNLAGRVFIVIKYSENVSMGDRGFVSDEKENGLVLVFNSSMNFRWEDTGIHASLIFGTSPQKCFIPADDIIAIYSPELKGQFTVSPKENAQTQDNRAEGKKEKGAPEVNNEKVVKVDFRKKKK